MSRKSSIAIRLVLLAIAVVAYLALPLPWAHPSVSELSFSMLASGNGRHSSSSPNDLLLKPCSSNCSSVFERLREDRKYLLVAHIGGFTNEVMNAAHIIHLALLTERIPIIPSFHAHPSQLGNVSSESVPNLPFGKVFSIPRLVSSLQATRRSSSTPLGILDWELDVFPPSQRNGSTNPREVLGVWSATSDKPGQGIPGRYPYMGFTPIFQPLPAFAMPLPRHPLFPALAAMFHSSSPISGPYIDALNGSATVLPSDHLVAIDNLYYASSSTCFVGDEWAGEGGKEVGAWASVGRHMRWTPQLEAQGQALARQILSVPSDQPVPPFITVHIRHGDFGRSLGANCRGSDSPNSTASVFTNCLSARQYAYAVDRVRDELYLRTSRNVSHVIYTTDDTRPAFISELADMGWKGTTPEMTQKIREEEGDWAPMIAETVLLSMGSSFVGTRASTMSILAARRIEDWHGGVYRYVNPGSPSAVAT